MEGINIGPASVLAEPIAIDVLVDVLGQAGKGDARLDAHNSHQYTSWKQTKEPSASTAATFGASHFMHAKAGQAASIRHGHGQGQCGLAKAMQSFLSIDCSRWSPPASAPVY